MSPDNVMSKSKGSTPSKESILVQRVGEVIEASRYKVIDFFSSDTMKLVEVKV